MKPKIDPAVLQGIVDRLKRERPAPASPGPDAAGIVHQLEHAELRSALVCRVFDFDVAATMRAGVTADEIRQALPSLGFRL